MPGRRQDTRAVGLAVLVATLIIAQQVAGKAVRDALFLSQFPISDLPKAMLAAAIVSIPAVLATSWSMVRLGPGWVSPAALALSAVLFAVEWAVLERFPRGTAVLVYLHVSALGGMVISAFWSVINERFDPHTAKRAMSQITTGCAIGGLIGGLFVGGGAASLDVRSFLLALALVSACCALGVARVAPESRVATRLEATPSGLAQLQRSPYLRLIAGLVAVVGLVSAMLDFAFKAQASIELAKGPALMSYFATFYMGTSILTAVLQATLARKALARLGLAGTMAILPAAVLLTGALGAAVQRLWSVTLLRGTATVLESSLFRSGYEPLYTPLPAQQKRSSKAIIDVAVSRLGDAFGGALILGLSFALPNAALTPVIGIAMAGAVVSLVLALRLHHAYVDQLATSLRSGALTLSESEVDDRTTLLTLSQTQLEVDRAQLLAQLAALRARPATEPRAAPAGPRSSPLPSAPAPTLASATPTPAEAHDAPSDLTAAAADLLSSDLGRAREQLSRQPLDARLTPLVIPLLAQQELSVHASAALKSVSGEIVGQLTDAMLDPERPVVVRRRLPRVLASFPHARSVRGLVDALRDSALEVRKRVALALSALLQEHPELAPPRQVMFDAVEREVRAAAKGLDLEHVFVILSMALDREATELARRALASEDDQQRGTALEYLETVLHEPLRSELWPHLQDQRAQRAARRRGSQELLEELRRSSPGERRVER